PTTYRFVVNLKTANAPGITVPLERSRWLSPAVGETERRTKYEEAAPTWRLHWAELKRDGALGERATSDLRPYLIVEIRLKADEAGDRCPAPVRSRASPW